MANLMKEQHSNFGTKSISPIYLSYEMISLLASSSSMIRGSPIHSSLKFTAVYTVAVCSHPIHYGVNITTHLITSLLV